jgi:hypothetical protein
MGKGRDMKRGAGMARVGQGKRNEEGRRIGLARVGQGICHDNRSRNG